jgi:tetratricopeptide (TPR) repeat protein
VALDGPWRLLNALQVGLRYAGLLVFPLHLSYDYSYDAIPLVSSLADPRGWGILGLSAALLGGGVWSYRASRELFFALSFLAITFSVVSNLALPIGTIMAERLLYLPSVGFCLALALSLRRVCSKLGLEPKATATLFLALMALIVGLHSARTLARAADWSSNPRLYLHDVEVVPRSVKALGNAGKILQDRGQHRAAIERFEQAIAIEPAYRVSYINWAYSLSALGRTQEAVALLEVQLQRDPPDPFVHNNLGFLLVERDIDLLRGVGLLERANRLRPDDPDILDSLAWGYHKLGRHSEAQELLQRSLALDDWSGSSAARRTHLATIERALQAR